MAEEEIEIDYEHFNQLVKDEAAASANDIISSLHSLNIGVTGALENSIKASVGFQFGIASKIAYKFHRHGVFVHKGVGRGYKIESVKSNGAIIGKASGKGRVAKPWFNPVIDEVALRLADQLQISIADVAVKSLFIK